MVGLAVCKIRGEMGSCCQKATLYVDIKCKTFFHTTFIPLTKSKDSAISIYICILLHDVAKMYIFSPSVSEEAIRE